VYCSCRQQWKLASLAGGFAAATRAQGVLILIAVGLQWAEAKGWSLTRIRQPQAWHDLWQGIRTDFPNFLSLALIPAGLLAYMLYLQLNFGSALAFNDSLQVWGRQTVGPVAAISNALNLTFSGKVELSVLPYYRLLEIAAFFVTIGLVIIFLKEIPLAYSLYCLASI